jgi:hypothetical protein
MEQDKRNVKSVGCINPDWITPLDEMLLTGESLKNYQNRLEKISEEQYKLKNICVFKSYGCIESPEGVYKSKCYKGGYNTCEEYHNYLIVYQ